MHVYADCPFCGLDDSEECRCKETLETILLTLKEDSDTCSSNGENPKKKVQVKSNLGFTKLEATFSSWNAGKFQMKSLIPEGSVQLWKLKHHLETCRTTIHIAEQFISMLQDMGNLDMIRLVTNPEWTVSLNEAIAAASASTTPDTVYYWANWESYEKKLLERQSLWFCIVITIDQVTNKPIFSLIEWRGYEGINFFRFNNVGELMLHIGLRTVDIRGCQQRCRLSGYFFPAD